MSTGRKFIAVAGNMGVGKSSLVEFLCSHFGLKPFYEPNAENPYLKDFYRDMKRWAFHSQMYFLAGKFRIHQELEKARSKTTVVQDRTIYEDAEIFASNLYRSKRMSKREFDTYQSLYRSLLEVLRPPDLMIYLRADLRTLRGRIKHRGRPEEQAVPIEYLRRLHGLYEEWFTRYDLSPTLVLETGKWDYVTDFIDRLDLLRKVEQYL
jgi:deoxyadenosine/deoxycytidine kinase